MLRRILSILVCLSTLACRPNQPDPKVENQLRTWTPSARDFFNAYADGDDRRWDGERVKITLIPESYTVSGNELHWHDRRNTEPPGLIFSISNPKVEPKDNKKSVVVIGVVHGRVIDNRKRASNFKWHVLVVNCTYLIMG